MHEILEHTGHPAEFERNFVREWRQPATHPFAQKCMYGSDHHMPRMIDLPARFLAYFCELFARERLVGFEDLCSGNARRYLKLAVPSNR